jgi:hypothetical protein
VRFVKENIAHSSKANNYCDVGCNGDVWTAIHSVSGHPSQTADVQ